MLWLLNILTLVLFILSLIIILLLEASLELFSEIFLFCPFIIKNIFEFYYFLKSVIFFSYLNHVFLKILNKMSEFIFSGKKLQKYIIFLFRSTRLTNKKQILIRQKSEGKATPSIFSIIRGYRVWNWNIVEWNSWIFFLWK